MTKSRFRENPKEVRNKYHILLLERSSRCKLHTSKLVMLVTCCTILSLLRTLTIQNEYLLNLSSRSRLLDIGNWNWQRSSFDPRYTSDSDINWAQLSDVLSSTYSKEENFTFGLLNFNFTEVNSFRQTFKNADISVVNLQHAHKDITWDVLYPEWIDEEEETELPSCPSLPEPKVHKGSSFDLVAVKLPCNRSGSWSRDVARLHLQLTATKLAAMSAEARGLTVGVLLITHCFPIPNLFRCRDLVGQVGNAWLYQPDAASSREKLKLPIGSCQLAVPLAKSVQSNTDAAGREAYATILHSEEIYVCGAIAVANSIQRSGSTRDLVILLDESIGDHHRSGLEAAGWKVRTIQKIENPNAKRDAYNKWNYSKFLLWRLTDYDKIIFIDADLLILRNIDFLFAMPEISAAGNDATRFNSGVMVVEPSNCTFQLLMDHINEITSYNGGDQGYLNEIFTWWHRIPKHMNFLKHFWFGDSEEIKMKKTRLYGADPPVLYVLHYLGMKPWLCFRDYDCNWNSATYWQYASDAAHATWWKMYDEMPEKLQSFCLLKSHVKANLEYLRRQAERDNYADGHWRRNITDPRLNVCFERFCDWESMLLHWGETNTSSKAL